MARRHEEICSRRNPDKALHDEHVNQGIANGVQQQWRPNRLGQYANFAIDDRSRDEIDDCQRNEGRHALCRRGLDQRPIQQEQQVGDVPTPPDQTDNRMPNIRIQSERIHFGGQVAPPGKFFESPKSFQPSPAKARRSSAVMSGVISHRSKPSCCSGGLFINRSSPYPNQPLASATTVKITRLRTVRFCSGFCSIMFMY